VKNFLPYDARRSSGIQGMFFNIMSSILDSVQGSLWSGSRIKSGMTIEKCFQSVLSLMNL